MARMVGNVSLVLIAVAASAVGFALYQASASFEQAASIFGSEEGLAKSRAACVEELRLQGQDATTLSRLGEFDWQLGPRWNDLPPAMRLQTIATLALCAESRALRFHGRDGVVVAEYSPAGVMFDSEGRRRHVSDWPLY